MTPRVRRENRIDVSLQVLEQLLQRGAEAPDDAAIIGCEYDADRGIVSFYVASTAGRMAAEGSSAELSGLLTNGGWFPN